MEHRFNRAPWSFDTNIYEVNIRQYTREGNFNAFSKHLKRLKNMGVEVLWFMPIFPISHERRIGTLGSYYACSDYTSINPEFGSLDDFKKIVKQIHSLGMKLILDWAANHTGWDHVWTRTNPEYFKKNLEGHFYDNHNWSDVIDLNYYDQAMRAEMIQCMKFWITECDIDGFRCDMAHLVPLDFWSRARMELDSMKELFWLAETEQKNYEAVFDVVYAWNWMHQSEKFWKGHMDIFSLFATLDPTQEKFPAPATHLLFSGNHDENSWNGTEYEKYGVAAKTMAVFSMTWHGIPLVYSGQEIPNYKRLAFFEKDELHWPKTPELHRFYQTLLYLRKTNPALKAGMHNSKTTILDIDRHGPVIYTRESGKHKVLVVLNFSANSNAIDLDRILEKEVYRDVFNFLDEAVDLGSVHRLEPGGYLVFEKIN